MSTDSTPGHANDNRTPTGRLSIDAPNLQSIPLQTQDSQRIRAAFTQPFPRVTIMDEANARNEIIGPD